MPNITVYIPNNLFDILKRYHPGLNKSKIFTKSIEDVISNHKCPCKRCSLLRLQTKCHTRVHLALKRGELIKKSCEKCGNINTQAHHADYSKPLEVIWLCEKHHKSLRSKTVAITIPENDSPLFIEKDWQEILQSRKEMKDREQIIRDDRPELLLQREGD